jgi:two-component system response regulator HydG
MTEPRVLVVDDEPDMLENCERLLRRAGYQTRTLAEPTRLREAMAGFAPDVVLLDLRMPGVDGMTALAAALAMDPALPVIIMTAYATLPSAVQAIREGAFDYLAKPFGSDQLALAVARAARYRGLALENRALKERLETTPAFDQVIGRSPAILRVLDIVRRVGPSDANVLLEGESGTGKELVAQCVHAASQRAAGPFLPIDCAALPENLLESELFGHERGAFTGAVARKTGLLVEGSGGTVFLDEIGELSPTLQAKLLRALETRQVRPVGGTAMVRTDFRIVAATNVDLESAVQSGRFRQDLYFRLNVVRIALPPLRRRTGDVALLLQHFLAEFAGAAGRSTPQVSPDAWEAMETHAWPGNVRELRNLAQQLVVLDDDGRVTLADLTDQIRGWEEPASGTEESGIRAYEQARDDAMAEFRRAYVRRLLAQFDGNVSRAAAAAGVSRRTMHRWLAEDRGEAPELKDKA